MVWVKCWAWFYILDVAKLQNFRGKSLSPRFLFLDAFWNKLLSFSHNCSNWTDIPILHFLNHDMVDIKREPLRFYPLRFGCISESCMVKLLREQIDMPLLNSHVLQIEVTCQWVMFWGGLTGMREVGSFKIIWSLNSTKCEPF